MAESLLVGAAVGAVFGELLKAVLEMKDKAVMFKPILAYLTKTLTAIDPLIKEIEQLNDELRRPKEELESLIRDMEEGTKLVYKCSKISRINIFGRLHCQEQLIVLAESLERFFKIDMQAQIARDMKETLSKVRRIHSAVNKMRLVGTQETVDPSLDVCDNHNTMGMQSNYESAMMEILESDTLQLSASGEDDAGISSSGQSNYESAMDEFENHNTMAMESNYESAIMEILELESLQLSASGEDVAGISSSAQTEAKAQRGQATTTEQLEPCYAYCISCGTTISQNPRLNTTCPANIPYYPYCIKCYNERIPGKIIAFEGCPSNFDLEAFSSAASKVLRETEHATTCQVILKNRTRLVMKRLKDVLDKEKFEQWMKPVAKLSQHPNVIMPLLVFHWYKNEKLLIYEYMDTNSFASLLQGRIPPRLDFKYKMKILVGVAKGIAHIHSANEGEFVHGNISSHNVLVTPDFHGSIMLDFVVTYKVSQSFYFDGKLGYMAPELMEGKELTQKCDVYSFGVVLLEMLTGKLATDIHLPSWVQGEAMDGILCVVFDHEIRKNECAWDTMQLAMKCVSNEPDSRPSMSEVVMKMERLTIPWWKKKSVYLNQTSFKCIQGED